MKKVVLSLGLATVLLVSACSRQQSDWEKTRTANTTDSYELFLKKYPNGEFAGQAQARLKELYEERDWQKARDVDSVEAYQAFLKQYPEGKWTEEARIRVENFTLASAPTAAAGGSSPPGSGAPEGVTAPQGTSPSDTAPPPVPVKKQPVVKPVKEAAATPKPAKHAGQHAGSYAVQLGAFKTGAAAANERWKHLSSKYPKILGGLTPKVTPRQDAAETLYRLQVEGLSDQQAHSICKSLKAQSQACIVVSPAH